MSELSETITLLEAGMEQYADQAITKQGGEFKNLPRKFFRRGAEDDHFVDRAWMIVYDTTDYVTINKTIMRPGGVSQTNGTLETIFGCPGTATRDDSTIESKQRSNWGQIEGSRIVTRESQRRKEAIICRNVAMEFVQLMRYAFEDCRTRIEDDTITENNPHLVSDKFIWWLVTTQISWVKMWNN